MTYNSIQFLFFLLVFLSIFFFMSEVWAKQIVVLAGSIFFYIYTGGNTILWILLATSLIVYIFSRCMEKVYDEYEIKLEEEKAKEDFSPKDKAKLFAQYKKKNFIFLFSALVLIIGILVYVKVGNLLKWEETTNIAELLTFKKIIIPIGISYYTFSSVGYLLDIYWRKAKCEKNYLKLVMCMIYFPHIVQGPISKYDKLIKQFNSLPSFSYERLCYGAQRMIWGFFKKMVVADRLALFTSTVFSYPSRYAGVEILLAVLFGAVEIYADFSGCMDIVLGVSQIMGVELEENFKRPFFSKTAAEFWRRWHITLGVWFKDYIYMPLAMNPSFMKASVNIRKKLGNRIGQIFASAIPLSVVWILTGLWHGTGATYLAWGIYWGIVIILGTVLAPDFKKINEKLHIDTETFSFKLFQMVRTFLLFCIGRMFTVTGSLDGFKVLITKLFSENKIWTLFDGSIYKLGLDRKSFWVAIFCIIAIWIVDILQEKTKVRETLGKQPLLVRWAVFYGIIVAILVFGIYGAGYNPSDFAYGRF